MPVIYRYILPNGKPFDTHHPCASYPLHDIVRGKCVNQLMAVPEVPEITAALERIVKEAANNGVNNE